MGFSFLLCGVTRCVDPSSLVSMSNMFFAYICVGLGMEGLFRVPGPQALIDELKEGFERGEINHTQSKLCLIF